MRLLEHGTDLRGITVEGLGVEDEVGMPTGTFDGVDCTFYYGGDDAASSKLIVIDQVKYSTINPNEPWTSARLTRSTNKKRDNSVIGRLAKVFVGIKQILADQLTTDRLKIRLISNQPIDESFLSALRGDEEEGSLQKLLEASGLNQKDFDAFRKHLDFSYCGAGSRLELERQIHLAIYRWTDEETQAIVEHLRFCVRNMMMPEKEGEIITRNKVLLWMKVSDPSALFPCPPVIEHVENRISRKVSTVIAEKLQNGEQFICLHGEAGCGKTTALREVEEKLPTGSVVLLFDCYGGGRYLDAVAYRHRPKDAFLELSNDLASALRMPFLLTRSSEINYPKAFLKRLQMASDSLSAYASNALLVVIIDAADNSITAASKQAPPERSFVQDFVHMGELPKNVRFVLTCRTGRLNSLDLPRKFEPIPMKNFDREETAIFVRSTWQNASDAWIDDFHHLSAGNPRVQRYAIDFARLESVNALDYLRPDGKALDQIFNDRFESALRKQGTDFDLRKVCAGLVVLPRPIPIRFLSGVAGIEIENVRDICRDLAPGVRLIEDEVGFADEDFEEFVRREASSEFVAMQGRIAEYFLGLYESEPYAAVHVAAALFEAGRAGEIVQLVKDQREPRIIGDPVLRREVQLKRLRIAMKVSRQMGNNVDALMTLLVGAEALKTDAALQKMFIENPDLVASFARDTASRDILRDPELIENHGSFLFQMMVSDARRGDKISVREGSRQLHAWLAKRKEVTNEEEKNHPGFGMIDWKIKEDDIAAQTEAVLRVAGLQAALNNLSRWRPRTLAIRVARILCDRLLASGDDKFLRECIAKGYVQSPWDLFILTPLALYGVDVDISLLETSIECLVRHGRLKISNELDDFQHGSNPRADYLETVLTACELVIARGGKRKAVIAALKLISDPSVRRRQRGFVANTPTIDLSLRAFALLENLRGRKLTLEKYWLDPLPSNKGLSKEEREKREKDDNEIKEEIRNFIGPIVGIYNVRALSIAGRIASSQVEEKLKEAIAHFQSEHYRFSRRYNAGAMSTLVALAISRLMVISRLDRSKVLSWAIMCLGEWSSALGDGQTRILARFCIEPSLHTLILENVLGLANTIEKFKTSAEQKIEAMVHLARLVLPISSRDAQALFNKAVDIAGELNVDAIHEVGVFLPLADRAADTMNIDQKREKAASIARVVSDAAIRLEGQEGFPWEEAGGSLAALDIGIALSAVARWEDSGIASRHQVLPSAFIKGLQHGTLSSSQVAGLLPLVEESDSGLINTILQCAGQTVSKKGLDAFVEEIARDQVLRTKDFPFAYLYEKLREVNHEGQDHFWMNKLRQSEQFFRERVSPVLANSQSNKKVCDTAERRAKAAELIESINWGESRFVSTEEIGKMLQAVSDKAREVDQYVDL
ncbi:MAG: ATP-binding protein [Ignavibacteriae bacterium]|nr:MAG: ATP-binding protein [Ignavibacteriota bacterium]